MIGVAASTISRIESGERSPDESTVLKLAAALQVSPAYLRYGAEPGIQIPISEPGAGRDPPDGKA